MEDIIIAFDAGGTSIKVAAMNLNNDFLSDIIIYPSHSHESAETIIHHFHNIIHQTFDSVYDGNQRLICTW